MLMLLKVAEIFGREIDTIYLTFSEPWPKKGDEKRRDLQQ